MRHGKLKKQPRKPAPNFTTAEKLHRRRVKRKTGPSAQRRAAIRHDRFVAPCGCVPHVRILCVTHVRAELGASAIPEPGKDLASSMAGGSTMKAGQDPRPDQQRTGDEKFPNPPANSDPKAAPGGVGTGTKDDPAKHR